MQSVIVLFRRDLRLADNPALAAAAALARPIVPVFAPDQAAGAASRWWLHHSLVSLSASLQARGLQLSIVPGNIAEWAAAQGSGAVYFNRLYTAADTRLEEDLAARGITCHSFDAALLVPPQSVRTAAGHPYQVFTPFYKACVTATEPRPALGIPGKLLIPKQLAATTTIEGLELLPKQRWDAGLAASWQPGEAGAQSSLERFCQDDLASYGETRNRPDRSGVSRLSAHLHFGEVSPYQIYQRIKEADLVSQDERASAQIYIKELYWREFAHYLLFHFPETLTQPLRPQFRNFPWCQDRQVIEAWQMGRTGYPIVDAGMKELWTTGWMHNRVRMIVASFLVKDLLVSWQEGSAWFWDTLVDADAANNTMGWQWSAGCGADAAPYFRIFNPVLQGQKFDPEGIYVRKWLPEIASLPNRWIHCPWKAPQHELDRNKVSSYPPPIVDHGWARKRALAVFSDVQTRWRAACR